MATKSQIISGTCYTEFSKDTKEDDSKEVTMATKSLVIPRYLLH